MNSPRIPRYRAPIIPVGGRSIWTELPPLARIAIGVAAGVIAIAVLRACLLS